jgi:hypothetical protein
VNNGFTPPFIASDDGDISIFPTLEEMASEFEVYDINHCEFFDADGQRIRAIADNYALKLAPNKSARPEPDHLEELLRSYFRRLRKNPDFSTAAERTTNLRELIDLWRELEEQPHKPPKWKLASRLARWRPRS